MGFQKQIIGLNPAAGKIIDFTNQERTDQASPRALRRRVEQLDLEMAKKSRQVDELKTTLSVVLQSKNKDMAAYEDKLLCSFKQVVIPYLEILENTNLNTRQRACVEELMKNIEDLTSPYSRRFLRACAILTPVEVRVAGMIKQGKTTKEIAVILCLSPRTVESHRRNIRKKLGLNNKNVNLTTHLISRAAG